MRAAIAIVVVMLASACEPTGHLDPRGTSASVSASWLVNGQAADEASCAAATITHVRVRFFDGDVAIDHAGLVFGCAGGAFDTRPERILAGGSWTAALLALNANAALGESTVVADGPQGIYDASSGHVDLGVVDFRTSASDAGP